MRILCRTILQGEGVEVVEAATADECLLLVEKQRPNLILLDWMLPGRDGADALAELKRNPATADIPVVMVTALDGLANISVATYNGADAYLVKPFEVDDLLALVHRNLPVSY